MKSKVTKITNDKTASENIIKLRELTEKLTDNPEDNELKTLVKKLKKIVDESKSQIDSHNNPQSKIKYYESMCSTITTLLTTINVI